MRRLARGFTLIEVMLAVAVFAFAAVGFAVALNDVLGIQTQLVRASQTRQAVESCAARLMAATNNLAPTGEGKFIPDPLFSNEKTQVEVSANPVLPPIQVSVPGQPGARPVGGWWLIRVRAGPGDGKQAVDGLSFLLWPR